MRLAQCWSDPLIFPSTFPTRSSSHSSCPGVLSCEPMQIKASVFIRQEAQGKCHLKAYFFFFGEMLVACPPQSELNHWSGGWTGANILKETGRVAMTVGEYNHIPSWIITLVIRLMVALTGCVWTWMACLHFLQLYKIICSSIFSCLSGVRAWRQQAKQDIHEVPLSTQLNTQVVPRWWSQWNEVLPIHLPDSIPGRVKWYLNEWNVIDVYLDLISM